MPLRRVRGLRLVELGQLDAEIEPPPIAFECGCSAPFVDTNKGRCDIHRQLLRAVYERWLEGTNFERRALWQEADGLGRRGYVPPGGRHDITMIVASTPAAVERMFKVLQGLGPLDTGSAP